MIAVKLLMQVIIQLYTYLHKFIHIIQKFIHIIHKFMHIIHKFIRFIHLECDCSEIIDASVSSAIQMFTYILDL